MRKYRMRSRLKTRMSTRTKIILASSAFSLLGVLLVIYFNFHEVGETKAFSTGDYRSIASGDWDDTSVWEVFDGNSWTQAAEPPDETVKTIQVTNNQNITISNEILVNNIVIDEGAELTIDANTINVSKFNDKGGIHCNGTLNMGTSIIEGNGDFVCGAKSKILIGSDAGIDKKGSSGNIQLSGKKEFHRDATYVFNGTIRQRTGNGLPAILSHLILDNSSGIEISLHLQVTDTLELLKGILFTGENVLTLGTSITHTGKLITENGSLCGNIKIWFGNENINALNLPFADASQRLMLKFIPQESRFSKGMLEMKYQEGVPDDSRKSPFEARQVVVGITNTGFFSAMLTNGAGEGWMQLSSIKDLSGETQNITWTINEKTDVFSEKNKSISNILYGPGYFMNQLVVRFYSEQSTNITIQMISQKGQIVQLSAVDAVPGYNQYVFHPTGLADGPYMVHIGNASEIHTFKAFCQNSKDGAGS